MFSFTSSHTSSGMLRGRRHVVEALRFSARVRGRVRFDWACLDLADFDVVRFARFFAIDEVWHGREKKRVRDNFSFCHPTVSVVAENAFHRTLVRVPSALTM